MSSAPTYEQEGFVVHSFVRTLRGKSQLCLIGRLSSHESFAAVITGERPHFFLRRSDEERARELLEKATIEPTELLAMDGESCLVASFATAAALGEAAATLEQAGVRSYEADVKPQDALLMDRHIHGSLKLRGPVQRGNRVDKVFIDSEILPAAWEPELSLLSLDIETNPFGKELYALGLSFVGAGGEPAVEEVLLVAPPGWSGPRDSAAGHLVRSYPTERALLAAFRERFLVLDPDLITGWNVIDFDLLRLIERMRLHGIPLDLGRSDEPMKYLPGSSNKPSTLVIPGRQVLDGIRIMRSAPQRYLDQSLETVAQEVLGYGKEISSPRSGRAKLEEIERLYREEPERLASYCLGDARLVRELLGKSEMLALTLRRCRLIGISLSRAWTSIAAFDFIYIEALHERGFVAPTLGVDALPLTEAPGGAIISPLSGLFDNVFVFDFRSLYPSIMWSFNIDPLSFVPEYRREEAGPEELILAPNGAAFRRERALLPAILERLFAQREEAKAANDSIASFVYKIVLNSFYGVLGAGGSRFAGSDLAGAITSFGHHILYWCRDFLSAKGYKSLYGDTDSLFVQSHLPPEASFSELQAAGAELCALVNRELTRHVEESYRVESRLLLQFEKIYSRFFVPPLRGGQGFTARTNGGAQPGRAKGYAGARLRDGTTKPEIEIRGMEAVRRDWTEAAKELQLALLERLFERRSVEEITAFIQEFIREIRGGKRDKALVYTKALRKSVEEYTSAQPAHVRAALRLGEAEQSGLIDYLWTTEGPQPVNARSAPIDYNHYLQKQLRPIAATFSEVLHADLEALFNLDGQLRLF